MNLRKNFSQHWEQAFANLSKDNCQLILAVSGGLDSVVLADLVFNAGFSFSIAHCNFQLRGEESARDEAFVKLLAEKYGVPVHVKQFDTLQYAEENRIGIQEAARELRYEWFEELVNGEWSMVNRQLSTINHQLSTTNYHLLTAHHADDNIETVLFNIFRGTGMNGLHGILPKQEKILRPLLFAKREEIMAYAKEQKTTVGRRQFQRINQIHP